MSHLHSRAGEIKSQAVTGAAQDSNNIVSAENAEQAITEESKKAGVAAYTFDPDASPEDKAAQVRSVSYLAYSQWTSKNLEITSL